MSEVGDPTILYATGNAPKGWRGDVLLKKITKTYKNTNPKCKSTHFYPISGFEASGGIRVTRDPRLRYIEMPIWSSGWQACCCIIIRCSRAKIQPRTMCKPPSPITNSSCEYLKCRQEYSIIGINNFKNMAGEYKSCENN